MFARPSGVVTLTTDFGLDDPYVGIMKGALMRSAPKATVVDLSHAVPPQDVAAGAFVLWSALRRFADGTVHVGVVDPGVGTSRRLLGVAAASQYWLGPDNGLLGAVLAQDPRAEVRELDLEHLSVTRESVTFDGRDAFAPVAGMLSAGRYGFRALGPRVDDASSEDLVFGGQDRVVYVDADRDRRRQRSGNPLMDLIGSTRPVRTGDDGRFEVKGLTPGNYSLRVESEALDAGKLDDVVVQEDLPTDVQLRVVKGAARRVRATNVDKKQIPLGDITLLDGKGKPVVSRLSTFTIMRRLMSRKDKVENSGWYEFGSVPPDTYTAILKQAGEEDIQIVRTIRDGETVEWDIDVGLELEARARAREAGK